MCSIPCRYLAQCYHDVKGMLTLFYWYFVLLFTPQVMLPSDKEDYSFISSLSRLSFRGGFTLHLWLAILGSIRTAPG